MNRVLVMFGEPISYGGQESVVYNMLSSFKLGTDFTAYLFTPYYADNTKLIDLVTSTGGKVYSLGLEFKTNDNRLLLKSHIDSFFNNINDNKLKFEIAHIHTGSLTTMYVLAKAAKDAGVKKVIVHSHIAKLSGGIVGKARRTFLNILMKPYVDVYIGCSKAAIDAKFTGDAKKNAIIVYNGIDIDRFKFNIDFRSEIRNKYNIEDKFVIGSLSRISPQKNIEFVIDVFAKLYEVDKNFILLLVGSGDNDYIDILKDKIRKLGIENSVVWTGNQNETNKYYCAFDVYVLPSHYEGLPVTSVEAQTEGLPVLMSDKITGECSISNGTKYLPIDNCNVWVDEILKIKGKKLKYNIDINKFDRNKTYKIIENMYKNK